MDSRRMKQIFYGAGYLIFFGLIIFGVYYFWLKPAPTCFDNKQNGAETGVDCGGLCASCDIKKLSPVAVGWTRFFKAEDQTIVVSEIKNSNDNYGANYFSYAFDIYDKTGSKLQNVFNSSLIYPSQIKYILDVVPVNYSQVGRIDLGFQNVRWVSKAELGELNLQLREIKTEPVKSLNRSITVQGIIDNQNAFSLKGARLIAFLYNKDGEPLIASKTDLGYIAPFDSSPFVINFPKDIVFPASPPPPAYTYNFTRDLSSGAQGDDVHELQRYLKSQGFFERETTNYFGPVTKKALINFQKKFNLLPANGAMASTTREYINSLIKPKVIVPEPNTIDPVKTKVYADGIR